MLGGGSTEALHNRALQWAGLLEDAGKVLPDSPPPMLAVNIQGRGGQEENRIAWDPAPLLELGRGQCCLVKSMSSGA